MPTKFRTIVPLIPVLLFSVAGCRQQGLTSAEAAEAKEEIQIGTSSAALTSSTVELTTNFTIGDAVEKAAGDLKAFFASQWACADVELSGHTLTVEYGTHGTCPYNSYESIRGTQEITISKNADSEVVVDHVWTDLSNGIVKVSGTAHVTWNKKDPSRHVEHDLTWTRLADGRSGHGTGDRMQRPLNGNIKVGFTEDGHRSWEGQSGKWDLDISNLEMRWEDPVPQSGTLTLDTPFDKTVAASFSRVNDRTIRVTLEGPRGSFGFNVSKPGAG
jgi:hypothetical protein